MIWKAWYLAKSLDDRQVYASKADTTTGYIETHLLAPRARRKIPRLKLMESLAAASGGCVSFDDILRHFYGEQNTEQARANVGRACA